MAVLNQDLNDIKPGMDFEPIPAGEYLAQVVDSDIEESRNGGSLMLKLTWKIIEGQYAGQNLFDRIILHGSEKGEAFGKKKLKTMAVAIGHHNPNRIDNSEELHGLPCLIKVGFGKDEYSSRNEVKGYAEKKKTAAAPPPPAGATTAPPPPAKVGFTRVKPSSSAAPPPAQTAAPPPAASKAAMPRSPFDKPEEPVELETADDDLPF